MDYRITNWDPKDYNKMLKMNKQHYKVNIQALTNRADI